MRHSSLKRVAVFFQKWQSLSYHEMAFSPMSGVNTQRLLVCGESQIHSSLCHPFYKAFQEQEAKKGRMYSWWLPRSVLANYCTESINFVI